MFACGKAGVDWRKVTENVNGDNFYVDFDRIRTNGGMFIGGDYKIIWNQQSLDTCPTKFTLEVIVRCSVIKG